MFVALKIIKILKSGCRGSEKSWLPWQLNFFSAVAVSSRTNSLPIFSGVSCKLTEVALFIFLDVIFG